MRVVNGAAPVDRRTCVELSDREIAVVEFALRQPSIDEYDTPDAPLWAAFENLRKMLEIADVDD